MTMSHFTAHRLALIMLATMLSSGVSATEAISLSAGTQHSGKVETRNSPIRIGDDVIVDGAIESRNGSLTLGNRVTVGAMSNRNGAIRVGDDCQVGNISARNGSVTLGDNSSAGSVDVRNGAVRIGTGSRVQSVENRNGSVDIDQLVEVQGSLSTRNGAIRGSGGNQISGSVESRNGAVSFASDSEISGAISTRNGAITLRGVIAGSEVRSRRGDINIAEGSQIAADVVIEIDENAGSSSGLLSWFSRSGTYAEAGSIRLSGNSLVSGDLIVRLPADYDGPAPSVRVESGSRVLGKVLVHSSVELELADGTVAGGVERIAD